MAEGGFSYVFLAKDYQNEKSYALKKMLCQSDEQVRSRGRQFLLTPCGGK